jgi:hypothetical protein
MREAGHFTSTLQLLIGLVIIASILFIIFTQAAQPLDAEHLKLIVSQLRSSAAEGNLLSQQNFETGTRQKYLQSQIELMKKDVQKQIQQLKTSNVKQSVARQKEFALKIANELSDELAQLPMNGKKESIEFKALLDELLSLESQLGKMS